MKYPAVLLASQSPRRKFLLGEAGIDFRQMNPDVNEVWPKHLDVEKIPEHLAELKARALLKERREDEVIIAADSIVVLDGKLIGKPGDEKIAADTLRKLSGRVHKVITGLCMISEKGPWLQSETAEVKMGDLTEEEIEYYIRKYRPFDKAGSYGIQEWLGLCRVEYIKGTFSNIMGLPMYTVYEMLKDSATGK